MGRSEVLLVLWFELVGCSWWRAMVALGQPGALVAVSPPVLQLLLLLLGLPMIWQLCWWWLS